MQYLIATTFEVVHYIALQAVHYKPLQEVHLSRYNHLLLLKSAACTLRKRFPNFLPPEGAVGQSRAALLTFFASERLSGMRTKTCFALLGCINTSFRSQRVSGGAYE